MSWIDVALVLMGGFVAGMVVGQRVAMWVGQAVQGRFAPAGSSPSDASKGPRITRKGNRPEDRIYKGECDDCGCCFKADAAWVEANDSGAYRTVVPCPQDGCSGRVPMSWKGRYKW